MFELYPELFLWCATLCLVVLGVFVPNVNRLAWLASVTCGITVGLMLLQPSYEATLSASHCFNTLIVDSCTYYCKLALVVSTACLLIVSTQSLLVESILLILLSTCSMLCLISAYDCMTLYLALELQSLCFYVLAASNRRSELSTEAGLKYFVLGAFSSGILLFGCSTLYGLTGVTNWEQLAILNSTNNSVYLGILFLAVGFLFKMTAVPFHMWAPDVYEGSPTYVTAFFATVPKIALLAAMVRVFSYSCVDSTWQMLFAICSCASMLVGALAGLVQSKVKRLLAYSSIAHVGYLLIGLACGTFEGIQALFLALAIYVVMTVNMFAGLLALPQQRHHRIVDLSGLSSWNPVLAATLAFTLFSFAGIPPLAGFFSKYAVFLAACGCGAYLLALIGVVSSVISCYYYLRLIKVMYFDARVCLPSFSVNTLVFNRHLLSRAHSYVLGVTTLVILCFCVYPSPILIATHQMALSFCF
jgi:proton-translocating NADH-quinone oxidoreductase chain N